MEILCTQDQCICVSASVGSCFEWQHKIKDMEGTPKICTAVSAYQQVHRSKAAPPSAYCYSGTAGTPIESSTTKCLLLCRHSRYTDQKQHHQVPIVILAHSEIFNVLRSGITSHSVRTQTLHIISQSWAYLPEFDAQHVCFTTGSPAVHNGYPTPQFGCADIFCLLEIQM